MRVSHLMGVAAALATLACAEDNGTNPATPDVTVGPGLSFTPATLTLTTKRAVVWGWAGGNHSVVFEDGAPGSVAMGAGTFTRDFTGAQSGTYKYRCTVGTHSQGFSAGQGMNGTIVVP
jgi:plastocyanin